MGRPLHSPKKADRMTLRIDPKLSERIRVLAARQKRSESAVVEEMIKACLPMAESAWAQLGLKGATQGSKAPKLPNRGDVWTSEMVRAELSDIGAKQSELAGLMGISQPTISLWLGHRGIPDGKQKDLSKALSKLRSKKG
ncbi:MAG: hypothetical protein HYZ13_03150 [Acidobacteria bacterium]|nr:hypothetical protein [Acidobacteriota bacterium]